MAVTAVDYYHTLGVGRDATSAQLKSAYLRLIREFTPENAPERYFSIAEAYRVLSNTAKRTAYDKRTAVPDAVASLLSQAIEATESDDHVKALGIFREITKRAPDYEDGWFFLGRAFDHANRHTEAAQAFHSALDRNPKNARTLLWLGDSERKTGNHPAARRHLKEAIVLDPRNSDAYHCLAWSYLNTDEDDEALKIVDRGIHADGQIDVQDLPLFIQKFLILCRRDLWATMNRTLQELDAAVPRDDLEARRYCAQEFMGMLRGATTAGRLDIVSFVIHALDLFDPDLLRKHPELLTMRKAGEACIARRKLYADVAVPSTIKALVQYWSGDATPDDPDEFRQNIPYFISADLRSRTNEWEAARTLHPDAISPLQEHWSTAHKMGTALASRHAGGYAKGGCLLLLATVSTLVASLLVWLPCTGSVAFYD